MATLETIIHDKLDQYKINILNPKTIQDKINWLMIHESTPLKGICADKIMIREFCKAKLGEDICVPLVKTYDSVEEINLDELPDKFVMKANHGFNMNIICKDKSKFDLKANLPVLRSWLKGNFGMKSGQPQYAYITPRILVEKLLEDENQKDSLYDYKFWCFNGIPKLWTINDGHGHGDIMYYDMDGNPEDLYGVGSRVRKYKKPASFDKMVSYAKILSHVFKFVRVDFYEVNGKVYLGELTFTPGNGKFRYKKPEDDVRIGDMLQLHTEHPYQEGVSVCVTGYKVQDYIEEALDSIYQQTWFKTHDNWEVILGIDCCMDTLNKVRDIMHKYKNLKVLMMKSNCGTYVTSNTIMTEANYSWLLRFDGDDVMLPELVETIMKEKGNADYIYYSMLNFGNKSDSRPAVQKTCGQMVMRHSMFDKLGGFMPWTCSADADLEIRAGIFFRQKYIKKVLMKRRLHDGNLTVREDTNMASQLRGGNLKYLMNVTKKLRKRQRAVVVRFTNSFTRIQSKNTAFTPSKYPFPKLDVIYQEGVKVSPSYEHCNDDIRSASNVNRGQNYMYGEGLVYTKKSGFTKPGRKMMVHRKIDSRPI